MLQTQMLQTQMLQTQMVQTQMLQTQMVQTQMLQTQMLHTKYTKHTKHANLNCLTADISDIVHLQCQHVRQHYRQWSATPPRSEAADMVLVTLRQLANILRYVNPY